MADDWLTADSHDEPAGHDWLTAATPSESTDEQLREGASDWLTTDETQLAFKGAKVLYGSPCGHAVPLEDAYWCEDSQLIIGEQCTSKELDSFLSPDCHHIYDLQQAEMFQNKSLNSFECPRCGSALCTVSQDSVGFYLACHFCRWDSKLLDPVRVGGSLLVDEKADQLILRLMKLEKEVEADQAVRILLKDMQGRADKTMMEKQQQQQMKKKKHLVHVSRTETQKAWGIEDLHNKLAVQQSQKSTQNIRSEIRAMFDTIDDDKSVRTRIEFNDGCLDEVEFMHLAEKLGYQMTKEQVSETIASMDSNGDKTVSYEEFASWWMASIARPHPPAMESVLRQDVDIYNDLLDAPPAGSTPLAQRITQPAMQPRNIKDLLPPRKALIPRISRRSIYGSQRRVVKPSETDGSLLSGKDEKGPHKSGKDEKGLNFDPHQLGLDHVPRFFVAELPEAEDLRNNGAAQIFLTVTNPLDDECAVELQDCKLAAKAAADQQMMLTIDEAPVAIPQPGTHKFGSTKLECNAKVTMPDDFEIGKFKIGSSLSGGDIHDEEATNDLVVEGSRSGNRLEIQLNLQVDKDSMQQDRNVVFGIHSKFKSSSYNSGYTSSTVYIQLVLG